jgi:hypothetical protein
VTLIPTVTDVFLITENCKSLELAKGYLNEPVFRKYTSIKCMFNNTNNIIVGVIPTDFTGNAMMDLMIVTKDKLKPFNGSKPNFKLWLLKGSIDSLDCNNTTTPLAQSVNSHPLILDYKGDMI